MSYLWGFLFVLEVTLLSIDCWIALFETFTSRKHAYQALEGVSMRPKLWKYVLISRSNIYPSEFQTTFRQN